MKVMQIFNNICHWDATKQHPTLAGTEGKYASNIIFVEAPDYVFEGWGYDPAEKDDARFIKPTPPKGWLYDDKTGTLYDPNYVPEPLEPEPEPETPVTLTQKHIDFLAGLMEGLTDEQTDTREIGRQFGQEVQSIKQENAELKQSLDIIAAEKEISIFDDEIRLPPGDIKVKG